MLIGKRYRICCPKTVKYGPIKHGVVCRVLNFKRKKGLACVAIRGNTREWLISLSYLKPYKRGVRPRYRDMFPTKQNTDTGERVSRPLPGSAWDGVLLSEVGMLDGIGDDNMGRGDKKKRSHKKTTKARKLKPQRRMKKGKKKKGKKTTHKRGSLSAAIFDFFDRVGLDKATYEKTLKVAKTAKRDTKFNRSHFSWYRNKYRLLRDID